MVMRRSRWRCCSIRYDTHAIELTAIYSFFCFCFSFSSALVSMTYSLGSSHLCPLPYLSLLQLAMVTEIQGGCSCQFLLGQLCTFPGNNTHTPPSTLRDQLFPSRDGFGGHLFSSLPHSPLSLLFSSHHPPPHLELTSPFLDHFLASLFWTRRVHRWLLFCCVVYLRLSW